MLLKPFRLHQPRTIDETLRLLKELPQARLLAGGTFLLNSLKTLKRKGGRGPSDVISLQRVDELKGVNRGKEGLKLGAGTTIRQMLRAPQTEEDNFKILRRVGANISTTPIRNMATIGGNLTCRYTWTELGAVVMALDGRLHFIDPHGTPVTLDPETFFAQKAKSPGLLTHVTVPHNPVMRISYQRVKKSPQVDIPLLCLCVRALEEGGRLTSFRVTVNNGVDFARRDTALERFLDGSDLKPGGRLDGVVLSETLDHMSRDLYDKRNDEYKSHMFRVCLRYALNEIVTGRPPSLDP